MKTLNKTVISEVSGGDIWSKIGGAITSPFTVAARLLLYPTKMGDGTCKRSMQYIWKNPGMAGRC